MNTGGNRKALNRVGITINLIHYGFSYCSVWRSNQGRH